MLRTLNNLDAIISKAEAHVAADDYLDESTLVQARLFPNMRTLVNQVQFATDTAKGAAARLSGTELPSWADNEKTFAEVHERIGKAISFLTSFKAGDFDGADQRAIELKLGPRTVNFDGSTYISGFVLPNFYFHVTTAYNILRASGVDIGKRDFLGDR
jgi:hypothetical protein